VTTTGLRHARWRERWAQQENERRATAYQASLAAWQRQDAEYRRLLGIAVAFQPDSNRHELAWLEPKRGEVVYWIAGGVGMLETPYPLALRSPDYREIAGSGATAVAPAMSGVPIDNGQVAVTSHRIVFFGHKRREWAYSKLAGIVHSAGGRTWMSVSNRKKVSGVALPSGAVADFRLFLALAMADAAGERAGLVAHLEEQVGRYRQALPPAPAPAVADQAPLSARLGRYGGLLVAVLGSALLLTLCAVGTALVSSDQRPEALPPPSASPTASPASPITSSPPRSPAVPSPLRPSPTEAPAESSPEPAIAEPVGDCAAYADSDGWCRDGVGDYDCEGGSGNGPNYAPQDVEVIEPGTDPFDLDRNNDGSACERPAPAPAPPPPPPPADDTDPRFDTCADAIDAGYGPYYRGQDPEYDWYRDADGDGAVCES
jgi:excalibur calcium-binding domain-containing protein